MTQPAAVRMVLPGSSPPWTSTGTEVCRGDRVTLLGSGRINWSESHWGGAKYHLWGRVPGGEVFGCTQDTTTVVVDRSGPLELCVYLGAWADRSGTLVTGACLDDRSSYGRERGLLAVTLLHWPQGVDPVDGLAALEPGVADPRLVAAERRRLLDPVVPPAGWSYLLAAGPGDIYRHAVAEGRPAIEVVCDDDAGVIEKDVDMALRSDTTIEWSWRVESLPGLVPENTAWTHDLLGIAAVFDTGFPTPGTPVSSLNWFWSSALQPEDDTFDCPVPGWTEHETHLPVRRGPAGLGRWRRETRAVRVDHERFMGPAPTRIRSLRLVAVSHFDHGCGRATFRDIILRSGGHRIQVL
ncbi:DUF3047 domain-containing protein [Pseudonocardia sp.]|jgi:hypothetical protein|uniref:DUF3047 domain-containing protein n=1 Tax=Pseudonocardia sp. TaxID=60912 RepID=UPI002D8B2FC7|nr:DUF3047 domain-containing protein [Pseudonocardia sp.]